MLVGIVDDLAEVVEEDDESKVVNTTGLVANPPPFLISFLFSSLFLI